MSHFYLAIKRLQANLNKKRFNCGIRKHLIVGLIQVSEGEAMMVMARSTATGRQTC